LAGDFDKGDGWIGYDTVDLPDPSSIWGKKKKIKISEIEEIAIASEESVKKLGGAVGWGAVGALALGPAGLLAGVLLGGNKKEVTFIVKFKDGKKFMATGNQKAYTGLLAKTM